MDTAWLIRKATGADAALINRMAQEVFPATYSSILSPEQLDYMMQWMYSPANILDQMARGHRYFLAFEGEKALPAGYVSFNREDADLYHLQKIYALPAYQGRGLGRLLFETVVSAIRDEHPEPFTLELNVNRNNPAVNFYLHLGMHIARSGDFPIGNGFFMNDYIMAKDL